MQSAPNALYSACYKFRLNVTKFYIQKNGGNTGRRGERQGRDISKRQFIIHYSRITTGRSAIRPRRVPQEFIAAAGGKISIKCATLLSSDRTRINGITRLVFYQRAFLTIAPTPSKYITVPGR